MDQTVDVHEIVKQETRHRRRFIRRVDVNSKIVTPASTDAPSPVEKPLDPRALLQPHRCQVEATNSTTKRLEHHICLTVPTSMLDGSFPSAQNRLVRERNP